MSKSLFRRWKKGYLTESKGPRVYAELIEKLINNPELRKQISEYNVAFARKHFLASNVARRLEYIGSTKKHLMRYLLIK